jgi:hypothetical protein
LINRWKKGIEGLESLDEMQNMKIKKRNLMFYEYYSPVRVGRERNQPSSQNPTQND